MAKFAPVAPIWLCRKLDELDMLGDYHLLLAHDVVKHSKEYSDIFGVGFRQKHKDSFIIMDNSLIELGHPASDDVMLAANEIIYPDAIVLPDYAHDMGRTVKESADAYNRWSKLGITCAFMCVAQGNTLLEYVTCVESLTMIADISVVGVPRNAVSKLHSRFPLIHAIRKATYLMRPEIHLLGFSEDVLDDVTCASLPFIRGIDSAVPLRAGLDNIWLTSPFNYEEYSGPRNSYWDEEKEITTALIQNVQRMRAWVQTHI